MASLNKKVKYGQNKSKYYGKPNREQFLAPGMSGFLATCNFREKDCIREAYNLLNHYADVEEEKVEKVEASAEEPNNDDILDQLDKEVDAAKSKQKNSEHQRFKQVPTGANNCIFIRTTLKDPTDLASRIFDDIRITGKQKTRFLLRLLPIEAVCRISDVNVTAGALFDKYFLKQPSTFAIVFNKRLNNDVKRDNIIAELADIVQSKNAANRVDLKKPEKTVIVEIIKGLCLLAVVTEYFENKKFNLVELAQLKKAEGEDEQNDESDTNKAENPDLDKSEEKQSTGEDNKSEEDDCENPKDDTV